MSRSLALRSLWWLRYAARSGGATPPPGSSSKIGSRGRGMPPSTLARLSSPLSLCQPPNPLAHLTRALACDLHQDAHAGRGRSQLPLRGVPARDEHYGADYIVRVHLQIREALQVRPPAAPGDDSAPPRRLFACHVERPCSILRGSLEFSRPERVVEVRVAAGGCCLRPLSCTSLLRVLFLCGRS